MILVAYLESQFILNYNYNNDSWGNNKLFYQVGSMITSELCSTGHYHFVLFLESHKYCKFIVNKIDDLGNPKVNIITKIGIGDIYSEFMHNLFLGSMILTDINNGVKIKVFLINYSKNSNDFILHTYNNVQYIYGGM